MAGIGERMLHVELELVVLEGGEEVDELLKLGQGGDAAAADIEHEATLREIRIVLNVQLVEFWPVAANLCEGDPAMAETVIIGGMEADGPGADVEAVGLGWKVRIEKGFGLEVRMHTGPADQLQPFGRRIERM